MLCALTVRKLKPGAFEEFAEAFRPPGGTPQGWVRFDMLRDTADPDRVVTFGFFDGSMDELNASQVDHGYEERREQAGRFVDAVEVNGVFEIAYEAVV
jgi:hypothetical protein